METAIGQPTLGRFKEPAVLDEFPALLLFVIEKVGIREGGNLTKRSASSTSQSLEASSLMLLLSSPLYPLPSYRSTW